MKCTTLRVKRGKVNTTNKGENFICLNYGLDSFLIKKFVLY